MKKVKMFFVCLFACLSVFAQKSETVVSDVTTSQGTSPEYIEPFGQRMCYLKSMCRRIHIKKCMSLIFCSEIIVLRFSR